MKLEQLDPPRVFSAGDPPVEIRHCANVELGSDEQVTFVTRSGTELDVVRKSWGYYGSPSLNRRLPNHRLRPVLALSGSALYLLLVEEGREQDFERYLEEQGMETVYRLDTDEAIDELRAKLA